MADINRYVCVDFPLVNILIPIIKSGIHRVVISYDVACKYNIHFMERITHPAWQLVGAEEQQLIQTSKIQWLVPKFHLAAHVEGCSDNFSFNWTKDVGRTSGESVESNWSSLGGLATSVREMGFGHRRDAINDAMGDWNWRKAILEGKLNSTYIYLYFAL